MLVVSADRHGFVRIRLRQSSQDHASAKEIAALVAIILPNSRHELGCFTTGGRDPHLYEMLDLIVPKQLWGSLSPQAFLDARAEAVKLYQTLERSL